MKSCEGEKLEESVPTTGVRSVGGGKINGVEAPSENYPAVRSHGHIHI